MLTSDQVFALFNKWKDIKQPVQVGCFFRGNVRPAPLIVRIQGFVKVVDAPTIVIGADDGSNVEMSLRECKFKSGANLAADKIAVDAGVADMLEIDFPTGEECIITAYRAVN
jgi:hypothetical protein